VASGTAKEAQVAMKQRDGEATSCCTSSQQA